MALGDKTAIAGIVIGIAVAVAGVALPLAFDIRPVVWRSIFCVGVLLSLIVSAYLVFEHFIRPHNSRFGKRLIFGVSAVLSVLVVGFSVTVPQPKNYGALILAKLEVIKSIPATGGASSNATQAQQTPASATPTDRLTPSAATPPPKIQPVKLVVECVGTGLPRVMPQDGHFRAMPIFHGSKGGSYSDQEGPAGSPVAVWVTKSISFRCEVTNYSSDPLIYVSVPIQLSFRTAINQRSGTGTSSEAGPETLEADWSLQIDKLDPGPANKFTVFLWNNSSEFVSFSFEGSASARRVTENKPERVAVIWPYTQLERYGLFLTPGK